jgi:hypothetical protein
VSASRLIVVLAVFAMGVTLLAGAIGYVLARHSDEQLWAEQRASLRNAIGESRSLFGKSAAIDPASWAWLSRVPVLKASNSRPMPEPRGAKCIR